MSLPSWHPADIRAALEKRGFRQKDLAAALGVSPSMISVAIRGGGYSERIRDYIANQIHQSPRLVWPHLYPDAEAETQMDSPPLSHTPSDDHRLPEDQASNPSQ